MSERVTKRLRVHGLVQGVGYRYATVREAEARGVAGWVRNRRDGSVEAVLQGPRNAVEAMIEWASRGPRAARVERVEVSDAEGDFAGFEARETD